MPHFGELLAATPTFTPPTLTNGWVNFGGSFNDCGYRRDPGGLVTLRGLIKSGTMQQAAFTLPIGLRPMKINMIATTSADAFGLIAVFPDGSVSPWAGTNTWISLDGISFVAGS